MIIFLGNGITDIVVGAVRDDTGGYDKGDIHIISLNPDGTPKSTVVINNLTVNGPELLKYD